MCDVEKLLPNNLLCDKKSPKIDKIEKGTTLRVMPDVNQTETGFSHAERNILWDLHTILLR